MNHPFGHLALTVLAVFLAGCATTIEANEERRAIVSTSDPISQDLVVYLVRHAEKVPDGSRDPDLTDAGRARADALADLLEGVKLTAIHSTDYRRTLETARPTAERHGEMAITLYGGNDLAALAQAIREQPGIHLVVGHSNTTNEVAEFISGLTGSPISDADYDRLYVVTRKARAEPTLAIVRFDAFAQE